MRSIASRTSASGRLRKILAEGYVGAILVGGAVALGVAVVEGALWVFQYINWIGLND